MEKYFASYSSPIKTNISYPFNSTHQTLPQKHSIFFIILSASYLSACPATLKLQKIAIAKFTKFATQKINRDLAIAEEALIFKFKQIVASDELT